MTETPVPIWAWCDACGFAKRAPSVEQLACPVDGCHGRMRPTADGAAPPEGSALDHVLACQRWTGHQDCSDLGGQPCDACRARGEYQALVEQLGAFAVWRDKALPVLQKGASLLDEVDAELAVAHALLDQLGIPEEDPETREPLAFDERLEQLTTAWTNLAHDRDEARRDLNDARAAVAWLAASETTRPSQPKRVALAIMNSFELPEDELAFLRGERQGGAS